MGLGKNFFNDRYHQSACCNQFVRTIPNSPASRPVKQESEMPQLTKIAVFAAYFDSILKCFLEDSFVLTVAGAKAGKRAVSRGQSPETRSPHSPRQTAPTANRGVSSAVHKRQLMSLASACRVPRPTESLPDG